jgi:hypothetical protein
MPPSNARGQALSLEKRAAAERGDYHSDQVGAHRSPRILKIRMPAGVRPSNRTAITAPGQPRNDAAPRGRERQPHLVLVDEEQGREGERDAARNANLVCLPALHGALVTAKHHGCFRNREHQPVHPNVTEFSPRRASVSRCNGRRGSSYQALARESAVHRPMRPRLGREGRVSPHPGAKETQGGRMPSTLGRHRCLGGGLPSRRAAGQDAGSRVRSRSTARHVHRTLAVRRLRSLTCSRGKLPSLPRDPLPQTLPPRPPHKARGRQQNPAFREETGPKGPKNPLIVRALEVERQGKASCLPEALTNLINDLALRTSWTYAL